MHICEVEEYPFLDKDIILMVIQKDSATGDSVSPHFYLFIVEGIRPSVFLYSSVCRACLNTLAQGRCPAGRKLHAEAFGVVSNKSCFPLGTQGVN